MVLKNEDLHGNVPDKAPVALLLIDVINDLEWEDGEKLAPFAVPMARRLAALKRRCKQAGIPCIYVNDNFGKWRSDLSALVSHCLEDDVRGRAMVELLAPEADDYFVLKPKSSAFFATTLDTLLRYLGATTLILTGVAGNLCVLFTAHDAYMRDFRLVVPADCTASNDAQLNEQALAHMRDVIKVDITESEQLDLDALREQASQS
jgi:nicotinamidase-related amidase